MTGQIERKFSNLFVAKRRNSHAITDVAGLDIEIFSTQPSSSCRPSTILKQRLPRFLLYIGVSMALLTALFIALSAYPTAVFAKVEVVQFEDPDKQALYQKMIQELRCLVCQNQNLADSNAELAVDLRRKTREMIEQGKTRQDIVAFMVDRYGEFVLYRPVFNTGNLVLWLSPVLLLVIALWISVRARNRGKNNLQSFSHSEHMQVRDKLGQQDTLTETSGTDQLMDAERNSVGSSRD
ncbi:MAG: cytochrome c-type biogenesis protein [bacterium]